MPSAKETLDKIAKAIGIVTAEESQEVVEETTEVVEETTVETDETVEESTDKTEDTTEESAEEAVDEVETEENKDEIEAPKEETFEDKSKERVEELEAQIRELKRIVADSLNKETEDVSDTPEIPVEDKGLTHSPEMEVETKQRKLGQKGGSIMSNVFKYINQ